MFQTLSRHHLNQICTITTVPWYWQYSKKSVIIITDNCKIDVYIFALGLTWGPSLVLGLRQFFLCLKKYIFKITLFCDLKPMTWRLSFHFYVSFQQKIKGKRATTKNTAKRKWTFWRLSWQPIVLYCCRFKRTRLEMFFLSVHLFNLSRKRRFDWKAYLGRYLEKVNNDLDNSFPKIGKIFAKQSTLTCGLYNHVVY